MCVPSGLERLSEQRKRGLASVSMADALVRAATNGRVERVEGLAGEWSGSQREGRLGRFGVGPSVVSRAQRMRQGLEWSHRDCMSA